MSELVYLDLGETKVTNLLPLDQIVTLSYLNLQKTRVSCLMILANLAHLSILDLSGTYVTDLTPLFSLPTLANLNLVDTPAWKEDIENLQAALPHLVIEKSEQSPMNGEDVDRNG
jgi:Leucine-rich repeat (LRR) protein